MKRLELAQYMKKNGISDKSISFLPCNGKYCLINEGKKWVIYFDDRNERTYYAEFESEDEACGELLNLAKLNQ